MPPKVIYHDDKSEIERIRDRLRPSSGETFKEWPADTTTTTTPTRTVTSVYHGSTQQNATVSGQPKGSHPEAVGVGRGTFFSDDDADFQKTYGGKRQR